MANRQDHRALPKLEEFTKLTRIKVTYIEGLGAYKDCSMSLENFAKSIKAII